MAGELMADTNIRPASSGAANGDFIALPPGTAVGRYTIRKVLGQGSFGITYLAYDGQLGRDVALKEYLPTAFAMRHEGLVVLPSSTRSAEDFAWGRQRFLDEARTLASFQRMPGIVLVHDFLEANGTAYMVMELVSGDTLEGKLGKDGPLPAAAVDCILRPLLNGLAKVHAAGFVHRDIKPANILLDRDGNPTLIDFGAARAAMASRTTALTGIYTPSFAAIEQFTDARQGPWTDIYGLAATLYLAISGRKPPSAIDRTLEDRYQPLAELKPAGFSVQVLRGIDRGLAVRPTDRPATIGEWRALLYPEAVAGAAVRQSRSWIPFYGSIAAVVAAIGVAAFFVIDRTDRTNTLRDAKVEELERALAERKRAEAASREQQQQVALTAARDLETQRTETVRRKAEEERLAQRRAEEEAARQKAAAEAVARQAEEARRHIEAERLRVEQAARDRAAAEQAARETAATEKALAATQERKVQEEAAKARAVADRSANSIAAAKVAEAVMTAESNEADLHLTATDRQRLQSALTALGFDTRGTDGVFGPRSRDMIAAWQKTQGVPATGYLTSAQARSLLGPATNEPPKDGRESAGPTSPAQVPGASQALPVGRLAPGMLPCNWSGESGGEAVTRHRHYLGEARGSVGMTYNLYAKPDSIDVFYRGKLIAGTGGQRSGRGDIRFDWNPIAGDYSVEVVVTGDMAGTRWTYAMTCPAPIGGSASTTAPNDLRLRLPSSPTSDYSFIVGCWRTISADPRQPLPDSSYSSYCFDANGRGFHEWRRGGTACRVRVEARIEGSTLLVRYGDANCNAGSVQQGGQLVCRRDVNDVALCTGSMGNATGSVNLQKY